MTFWPIRGEASGTTTSVKNFIVLRGPSMSTIDSRSGIRSGISTKSSATPTIVMMMPTGAISSRPKGARPFSRATPSTSRLVEVPIIEIMPASTVT